MHATTLSEIITAVNAYKGSWIKSQELAWEVNRFLWATYDPKDAFVYTNKNWDLLLLDAMKDNRYYDTLAREQVLSILFGLHHRNRIVDDLWASMFERGVTQKLLERLLVLDDD